MNYIASFAIMSEMMAKKKVTKKKDFVPEAEGPIAVQVGALALSGKNIKQMSDSLGITRHQVRKYLKHPDCTSFLDDAKQSAQTAAVAHIRTELGKLAPEVTSALKRLVTADRPNIDAIKTVLKVMGALDLDEDKKDSTPLTIVMPTAVKQEKVVEVKVADDSVDR